MEQNKVWHVSQHDYYLQDITSTEEKLEPGVYELRVNAVGIPYLALIANKFEFGFKVYGLERPFIEKVIYTYNNTTGNLGVLCNGVKGTGKSVTAEIMANKLRLPIVLITHANGAINTFLTSINQDLVIFIDEYEKVYGSGYSWEDTDEEGGSNAGKGDGSLLSLMDGVLKTDTRKVFLLTSNRLWINENMLNRPGRIRYLKHFGDLTLSQIQEILDDLLEHKEWEQEILDFIKPLKIITVDIIKSIISEVNIYNESPVECCKDFNIEFKDDTYNVIQVNDKTGKEEILMEEVPMNLISNFIARAKLSPTQASIGFGNYGLRGVENVRDGVYKVYDSYSGTSKDTFLIRFEKVRYRHNAFAY